jgi:hypothetical protein
LSIKKEMMMKTRIFFMLFAVALLWCGCSKNDDESGAPIAQTDDDDARLIRVSASATDVIASQSTRAVVGDEQFSGQDALVLGTKTENNYATLHCNGTMTFNGIGVVGYNDTEFTGSKYFPAEGTVYLSGFYPASNWTISNGTVTHTVDGETDLMYAQSVPNTKGDDDNPPLTFTHVLTLLNLSLKKDEAAPTITVNKIELTGTGGTGSLVNTTCNVNLNTPEVTFSGGTGDTKLICNQVDSDDDFTGQSYDLETNADEKAWVLAPSLKQSEVGTPKDYTLSVTYSIDTTDQPVAKVDLQLTSPDGSTPYNADTAGHCFDITLNFKGGGITATAKIVEWKDGGTFIKNID